MTTDSPAVPAARDEAAVLAALRELAEANNPRRSLIGTGWYGTVTPPVIRRNVLENPAWYTAYTPYQPEISQGRLEALLNFQTMVTDLTGTEIANASMLDEATAAAEAMALLHRANGKAGDVFVVDPDTHQQTHAVIETRAEPLGLRVVLADPAGPLPEGTFGVLVSHPGSGGRVRDIAPIIAAAHDAGALVVVATDLLACTLLTPPGEMGADVVVGSSQRFGVPLGFGGPERRVPRHQRGPSPQPPRPPGRRLDRRRRPPRLPPRPADPRAAHPPGEGHLQHLHRPGAAGRHGRPLRRVARPRGPAPHRHPGAPPHGRAAPRACAPGVSTWPTGRSSTRSR